MLLVSVKAPQICKVFLPYNIFWLVVVNECLASDVDRQAANLIAMLMYLTCFFALHYDFWITLGCTIIYQGLTIPIQLSLYREELTDAVLLVLINLACLLPMILLCHGFITAAGFLYTDSDMTRKVNTQMLDDLDEGILVYDLGDDNDGSNLLFQNQAARELSQQRQEESLSMLVLNESTENAASAEGLLANLDEKLFASCPSELFKDP